MKFASAVRSVTNPMATLVLMHGLGSDEQDMRGFADMLDDRFDVVCLRAPQRYGPGYAWFDIQWTVRGIEIDPDQYWQSVEAVAEYFKEQNFERLILGGFSQGAMMSLGVITKHPDLAKGAVLLSGRGIDDICPAFDGPIFHAHGAFDDVISVEYAYVLRRNLSQLGDRYEFHEYEMGHWINEEEVADLNRWLARFLEIE
ncbi:MAG: alpha/beta fold hydrolase [Armatimonadetes bacterium]|nr:alpha/beta fold hydrolase [Armatimonadota bacterium]MBS1725949.1 alpha/beta fold hydrolase [Armatimonadota bacterium]